MAPSFLGQKRKSSRSKLSVDLIADVGWKADPCEDGDGE
jgi:hypothetical protein